MVASASTVGVGSMAADSRFKKTRPLCILRNWMQVVAWLCVLLLWPAVLLAQSPWDGTWVVQADSIQLPRKPEVYLLQNGTYECSSCVPRIKVESDGKDHPVAGSPYFTTIAVQVINDNRIQISEKQAAKTVYTETDILSSNGTTLVQKVIDSAAPNGEPVTATVTYKRLSPNPAGASPISGSWQAEGFADASENGTTVTYHSIPGGLEASNPSGEGYSAKFDGKDYPIHGEPAHNTVSLKRAGANMIVETDKQDGIVHYQVRMVVSRDGNSMQVTEIDRERGTQMTYTMKKKS
jgi:hypothetical protein